MYTFSCNRRVSEASLSALGQDYYGVLLHEKTLHEHYIKTFADLHSHENTLHNKHCVVDALKAGSAESDKCTLSCNRRVSEVTGC